MSREIKFRAWSIKKRKYLDIDTSYCANGKVCGIVCDGVVYDTDNIILEQDTGLKDKNGKEICEGDIVKLYDRYVSAIIWQDDYCGFRWHSKLDGYCILAKDSEEYYEVIGNIHENQELLEKGE